MQADKRFLVDRYRLETKIASGGMGTVYRAVDERLRRPVAVKLLREHLIEDERALERFRREAQAVASLTHPNIARVYDYVEDAGQHFIVMELVEGEDLASVIRDGGALGPHRAPDVAVQVCDALSDAHALRIVHRDIKPANVLIGKNDVVKVTDFGIARVVGDGTLTASGMFMGTATYVAPEVAEGLTATPLSDIYSLGVVLFEMLTGFPPFEAESPVAMALEHISGEVPLPSTKRPDVPDHLDEAVRRATAKDPGERFRTTAEFAEHLRTDMANAGAATLSTSTPDAIGGPATSTLPLEEASSTRTTPWRDAREKVTANLSAAIDRLRGLPRAWLIGLGLFLALLLTVVVLILTPDDPAGLRQRETRGPNSAKAGSDVPGNLPAPLENAFEELERAVRP